MTGELDTNAYDLTRVDMVVKGMLQRYSTPRVAYEMACYHSSDFTLNSPQYTFWSAVADRIRKVAQ